MQDPRGRRRSKRRRRRRNDGGSEQHREHEEEAGAAEAFDPIDHCASIGEPWPGAEALAGDTPPQQDLDDRGVDASPAPPHHELMDIAQPAAGSAVPPRTLLRELAIAMTWLAAVGLIAIGVSGVLAVVFGATLGQDFVAGDRPGVTYTPARCADLREYAPGANTCREAATVHHYGEIVDYRIAAGLLGIGLLGAYLFARRRHLTETSHLPAAFTSTVGVSVFGLAGAALLAISANLAVLGDPSSVGQYLSGGIVSAVVAAAFGWSLVSTLLGRRSPAA